MASMVAAADMALCRAKSEGRDRAVVSTIDDAILPAVARISGHAAVVDVKQMAANV